MTGNLRSRHAFHNTFGDNTSENEDDKKIPNKGTDSYSNTSSVTNPFQNQASFQHSSAAGGSIYSTSIGSDTSIANRSNVSSKPYSHGSNVSSPFPKTHSLPFYAPSSVPNPTLAGNLGFQGTPVNPMPQYAGHTAEKANLSPPAGGFTTVPNFNAAGGSTSPRFQAAGYASVAAQQYNTLSQSQKSEDKSMLYLDGQLDQNPYSHQPNVNASTAPVHVNTGGYQNTNAVTSTNTSFNAINTAGNANTLNFNPNAVNLSNLGRAIRSNQSFQAQSQSQTGFPPLPAQIGAQLTKFGEIYNQRLQQSESDDEVDPPLLDELGINVVEIYNHMVSVMVPKKGNVMFLNYDDLYGPLLIFVAFALGLMFSGKICFSTIYVLFVFCNLGIYMLFNFLNETYISFSKTVTILGYSLLPLCVTPVFGLLSRFIKVIPVILVYVFVLWSTISASYLFQVELNLKGGLHFIMYPILLYYATFANVVIY